MSWRDLSYRIKTYSHAVRPDLRMATEKVEHRSDMIQDSDLGTYKIDMATKDALKSLLTVRTLGRAHGIIRKNDLTGGFEQYRCLAQYFEADIEA